MARKAADEFRTLRSLRADVGLRRAIAARARVHLEFESVPARLSALEAASGATDARVAELERRATELERRAAVLDFRAAHSEDRLAEAERTLDGVARLSRATDAIQATTALVAELPPSDTLVTVIMPTYNRATELPKAIASVRAQTHQAWELIVVDDGSDTPTGEVLDAIDDPRVVAVHRPVNQGASAARNAGIERAHGELIVYLDDDNVMRPLWLRAVIWAFECNPDADVAYGARAVEFDGEPHPWVQLDLWDRNVMQTRCLIDQNVIAHRTGLPEARLKPDIETGSDWDMAMRLTEDRDPVCIPVIAVVYYTGAGDRLSDTDRAHADWVAVQRSALRRRPLRVLAVRFGAGASGAELAAADANDLRRQGAEVREWHEAESFERLDAAAAELDPRAIAVYADVLTGPQIAQLERLARPFFVRPGAGPGTPGGLDRALGHPFCAGELPAAGGGSLERELLPALDRTRARMSGFVFIEQAVEPS
jgi:hypothetical protein